MKNAHAMDADVFTDRFFAIEERLGLFQDRSIGYAWWDAVRYDVYRMAYAQVSGLNQPGASRQPLARRVANLMERTRLKATLHRKLRAAPYDVLVLRAPRQKRNGRPTDVALDGLIGCCPGRHLVIDTFPHHHHLPRPKPQLMPARNPAVLSSLARALSEDLGLRGDANALQVLVRQQLQIFEWRLQAYRRLLAQVRPKLVLLVQNGMEKALFRAAHEAGIAVVEAQHGLIGHAHPGYSYPRLANLGVLDTLPDVFLTFSEHWSSACHYPVQCRIAVGNDYFHVKPLPLPAGQGAVMAVSANIYHAPLLRWLRPAAAALPQRRFIYKLHPNQHADYVAICKDFADLPNVQVVDSAVSAASLLPEVSHVVLVQSTTFFEALQAGRGVCVLPELNYHVHKEGFGWPRVCVPATRQELVALLQAPTSPSQPPRFFEAFDATYAAELLGQCLRDVAGCDKLRPTEQP